MAKISGLRLFLHEPGRALLTFVIAIPQGKTCTKAMRSHHHNAGHCNSFWWMCQAQIRFVRVIEGSPADTVPVSSLPSGFLWGHDSNQKDLQAGQMHGNFQDIQPDDNPICLSHPLQGCLALVVRHLSLCRGKIAFALYYLLLTVVSKRMSKDEQAGKQS